ncbi:YitT family protein [Xanthovirga aplysinae]|uniref:YitT family protein n=1 Tax=Xanthovirga aplysinae TaxID=2529853 RepID=UPI0012BD49FA|nr:YitT family protein [Xanthovirga aplysinae]MTI29430.1 YitT family protein [Xanthovirga aplysinae]
MNQNQEQLSLRIPLVKNKIDSFHEFQNNTTSITKLKGGNETDEDQIDQPVVEDIPSNQREWNFDFRHFIRNSIFILLGVLFAGFGLKSFLVPTQFIDGGMTGLALIIEEVAQIPFAILLIGFNLPFVILGYSNIGKAFAIKSILAISLLAVFVHTFPYPIITYDKLLIPTFGGFFIGLGTGLAIRGGAVLDGMEVLAVYLSRKVNLSIGDIVLLFNIIIFSIGAYVLSIEVGLYAILTYLIASKTIDFVIDGIEEYIGVTIISKKSEEIRLCIIEELGRGCTIYDGKNGYAKKGEDLQKIEIIYTVITRLELSKLQGEIKKIDAGAFVVMNSIKDTKGGLLKKKPFQH